MQDKIWEWYGAKLYLPTLSWNAKSFDDISCFIGPLSVMTLIKLWLQFIGTFPNNVTTDYQSAC